MSPSTDSSGPSDRRTPVPDTGEHKRFVHPYATRVSKDHRIAARVGKQGREAPPSRHVRVGRQVRFRRTMAGGLLLVVLGAGGFAAADQLGLAEGDGSTKASPPTASVTAPPASDGSATTSAASSGETSTPEESSATPATSSSSTSKKPVVPTNGTGEFTVLDIPGKDTSRDGRTVRFTVEVEGGMKGVDTKKFASMVREVLSDKRGWETVDNLHFVNVSKEEDAAAAPVDIRITLTTPDTVDLLCQPLQTNGQVSCWNGERSVINVRRWQLGVPHFEGDLETYRVYVINHEVGHGLGHQHEPCPGEGERAPVMLQQTLTLDGCQKWAYPKGA